MTTDALAEPATIDAAPISQAGLLEGLYLYPQTVPESPPPAEAPSLDEQPEALTGHLADGVAGDLAGEPQLVAAEAVQYQWRHYRDGQWSELQAGDLAALMAANSHWPAQVVMVLPADQVVTRTLPVELSERRYYKKLAPFQLEEDIIDDVSDLHFVYGPLGEESVDLAYCRKDLLDLWLAPFFERELPVSHLVSASALLPEPAAGQWALMLEPECAHFRLSATRYGAVQPSLLPAFVASLAAREPKPEAVQLLATGAQELATLKSALPASLAALAAPGQTLGAPLAAAYGAPNLAVEQYSPRIPLTRWLRMIKVPALVLAAGLCVHLSVALTEWYTASSHTDALKTAITERYRAAVPSGAISDPLKQLRNQVNRAGGAAQGSNALQVLARAVPVLTGKEGVEVKNLQFSNSAQELRLTIQARALADIESLSSQFKAQGFSAEVLSVNVNNGVHQARMKVTRK
ncbi:type II secretion system protein GspL [Simiduia sp. 21SJ11W-1]|uniref:type II secretion system protein GspL n=1 Tax=Simiduia sp. 21SJ11W-1 TaxID=2909669 RepID=UPI0020A0C701|nr:type II secretion system protein GspL [Simiduia sp. 21SJ11W-1]UTA47878.1 type II secretion system protein GspL [Simiduia sp. 21SJ11W-1]